MSDRTYLVTARKYRPQRFSDIVSQSHVTDTLKNALRMERLAHAYLFAGPRGVGKTTAARILAKSINCTTPPEERTDGSEPCLTCDSCRTFIEGRSLNVIEIDAASNNKVEHVRELRDTVRIPPQGARKKVYIVDEVHMLSNSAFNAFLKTLEEPPDYALFIFATTEPKKVIPTILSRCQRFDFRRIALPEIIERLRFVCEAENVVADEQSLILIAQKGDGSLRDALSVFDQAVSLCGSQLRYTELADALGVVDIDLFFEVTECVVSASSKGMLDLCERLIHSGYDITEFLAGLAIHVRNLLVAATTGEATLIETAEETGRRYLEAAARFTEPDLLRLLMIVSDTERAATTSTQPRLRLELGLLKMANLARSADIKAALSALDRIEGQFADASPRRVLTTVAPAAGPSTTTTRDEGAERHRLQAKEPKNDPKDRPAPQPDGTASPPQPESETASTAPAVEDVGSDTPAAVEPVEETGAESAAAPASPPEGETESQAERGGPALPSLFGPPALRKNRGPDAQTDGPKGSSFEGSSARALSLAVTEQKDTLLRLVETQWLQCVRQVKAERIHVGALLQHSAPSSERDRTIEIAVPDAFHKRLLSNQHEFLLKHLQEAVSDEVEDLTFVVKPGVRGTMTGETAETFDPHDYMQKKRQENPIIKAIFDEFGGELVW